MSRTDKDRPYWVIMNDRTLGTVEHHDHAPRYRRYNRVIERGERTLVYGEHFWNLRHPWGTPGLTVEEHYAERNRPYRTSVYVTISGDLRWYYEPRAHYEWVGRIEEPVEPAGCTVDQPYSDWRRHADQPCTVEPPQHNHPYGHYYDRPRNAAVRRDDERARRRQVGPAMRSFVNEYNTFRDIDDSEWQDFQHRHTPVGGGWWD